MSNKRRKPTNADKRTANRAKQSTQVKKSLAPLSEFELELLEDILMNMTLDELEEEPLPALTIDEVDGLFAALALHSQIIEPSEWIEVVLGDAVFESQAQASQVMDLLMRHYNYVVSQIRTSASMGSYQPLSYDDNDDMHEWCHGFILGTGLGDKTAFIRALPEGSNGLMSLMFILAMSHWDNEIQDFFEDYRTFAHAENMGDLIAGFKGFVKKYLQRMDLPIEEIEGNYFAVYMAVLMLRFELIEQPQNSMLSKSRTLH
jgi:yecA family protein